MKRTNVLVYPVYLDNTLSESEGRKIPKEAGLAGPHAECMLEAVRALGFEATLDVRTAHPRNFWQRGRISVVFFADTPEGAPKIPLNPEIPNRKSLYTAIAKGVIERGNKVGPAKAATPAGQKLHGSEKAKAKRDAKRKS
jgi:signal recognition particle subunit SRP19